MSAPARRTALYDRHAELGATFTDFAGWSMPLRYTSDVAEHHAVRRAAGIFDLSHMAEIEVSGPDAAAGLDAALVSDIAAIAPGRAKYTMLCADDGGVLDDLVVYRTGEQSYLVVANAANAEVAVAELRARIGPDRVADVSGDWSLVAVQGPAAAATLATAIGTPGSLRYYAIETARIAGHDVALARTGYTGEDGFEVFCRPAVAVAVWDALRAAGAPHGLLPAGLASRDSLRLEAGMPLYGQELSRQRTPFEAGLGRVVAVDKAVPFVGQEALRARRTQGSSERLVGLAAAGRRSPRTGYAVLDPQTGASIGAVTSGIPSPTLGRSIAMAYVPADRAVPGTELAVDVRGRAEPVTVVELPFYRRERPAGP